MASPSAHPQPTAHTTTSASTSLPPRQYFPRRFILIGLCFLSTFICYIDRVNMSVAIIPMADEFKWAQTTKGIVLSSFFYGYLATQVLGGWLADRYSGKVVLGFGVLWWSIFTLLTPPAAAVSLAVLFIARVGMGLGEGVAFPAIHQSVCSLGAGARAGALGRPQHQRHPFGDGRRAGVATVRHRG